jgi:hypothetical protein
VCQVIWLAPHGDMSTVYVVNRRCLHVSLVKKCACEQESNRTLYRYIFQHRSPRFVTTVDKMIFGNIFDNRHAKLVWFALIYLYSHSGGCGISYDITCSYVHPSKKHALRRQLAQGFFSLSRLDFLGTDIDKNCLQFCEIC